MSKSLVALLASTLLVSLGARSIAAQGPSDSVDRYTFDLDTQAGHYSLWALNTLRHDCLHARLIIGELRRKDRWVPGFDLRLRAGEGIVFLRIWAPQAKPPLRMVLERGDGRQLTDSVPFARTLSRDDTFHVDLDWSRAGVLRAAVDSEVHEISLPFRPTSFEISGSTGQIKADSLDLFRCR